jgi:molybdopterin converting factor subunit 1
VGIIDVKIQILPGENLFLNINRRSDVNRIKIHLLLFGACRESAKLSESVCEVSAPADVARAWNEIRRRYPPLEGFDQSVLFAVNEEHVRRDHPLKEGDTLAIFPPVSGG